jgi:hypothetical protein
MEQGNRYSPLVTEKVASHMANSDRMLQEANALGNAGDKLTWSRTLEDKGVKGA